jgi:hypothetical protein
MYQSTDIPEDQISRIQLVIGELGFRTGDLKTASEFFIKVKLNKQAGAAYQHIAEDRISDIIVRRK